MNEKDITSILSKSRMKIDERNAFMIYRQEGQLPLVGRCPHCGRYGLFVYFHESSFVSGYRVICISCGTSGPVCYIKKELGNHRKGLDEYGSFLEAVECWNRMTNDEDTNKIKIEYEGRDRSGFPFFSSIRIIID